MSDERWGILKCLLTLFMKMTTLFLQKSVHQLPYRIRGIPLWGLQPLDVIGKRRETEKEGFRDPFAKPLTIFGFQSILTCSLISGKETVSLRPMWLLSCGRNGFVSSL